MSYLYVLKSLKDGGYYIEITENVEKRLKEHNSGKTKAIKSRIPFILIYKEKHNNKTEARKAEINLKKNYQKRKFLLNSLGFNLK